METLDDTEFEKSFKGLINIIVSRKLFTKKPYLISSISVALLNILFFLFKGNITSLDYFDILKIFVATILPAFITFCGFTMTAYSLVVGFLNYGVFKTTMEKWYRMKIETEKENSKTDLPKFSLYQNGIALFALAILVLLITIMYFLIVKFICELAIVWDNDHADLINAFLLFLATFLGNFSIILMIYNVVNIFTFSQSLNQLVYIDVLGKIKGNNKENIDPK